MALTSLGGYETTEYHFLGLSYTYFFKFASARYGHRIYEAGELFRPRWDIPLDKDKNLEAAVLTRFNPHNMRSSMCDNCGKKFADRSFRIIHKRMGCRNAKPDPREDRV